MSLPRFEDSEDTTLYDGGTLKKFLREIDGEDVIVDANGSPIEKSTAEYFRRIESSVFN